MQSHLVDEALKVIKNPQILINIISRRVCQLSHGHRVLVEAPPGYGFSDIALMEVIQKKIAYEATVEFKAEARPPRPSEFRNFSGSRID
jgi:DNA-directed RNA polymerase subunit omega